MSEWNIDDGWSSDTTCIAAKALEDKALKVYEDNLRIITAKLNALDAMCPPPMPGEQYVIVTEKQFNAFALIMGVLSRGIIEDLHIAIYRINDPTVNWIIRAIEDGRIRKATFVISSFFNQTKKPERWARRLREFCDSCDRTKHVYTHNHSKVVAILDDRSNHYVFEGSGNMSDNARIEQYRYENNEAVYDFHCRWMEDLCR